MRHTTIKRSILPIDRIAATIAALVIVGLMAFLLIRNEPIADSRLFFGLRLLLSFGAATLGASIPGFLNVGWSGGGWVVRAGGCTCAIRSHVCLHARSCDSAGLRTTDQSALGGAA